MNSLWELMAKEYAAAERKLDEDDERRLAALRGEPFWRSDAPSGTITGLADWLPGKPDTDDLETVLTNLKPPRVT